tara:strand:- start:864 stop:1055 length:192 start_codon:yes stop_codon:yes gene_type:complete
MDNTKFRFLLKSTKTPEVREYFSEAMTFNEAISDAYIQCNNLRGISGNTWKIVLASDESYIHS